MLDKGPFTLHSRISLKTQGNKSASALLVRMTNGVPAQGREYTILPADRGDRPGVGCRSLLGVGIQADGHQKPSAAGDIRHHLAHFGGQAVVGVSAREARRPQSLWGNGQPNTSNHSGDGAVARTRPFVRGVSDFIYLGIGRAARLAQRNRCCARLDRCDVARRFGIRP